ncbi:ROK family transcriptional regulator [Paenibacillus sp. JCM 10914]
MDTTRADGHLMKEINLNHVRRVMKRLGVATKPQLAGLTGLSVVTITSLIRELMESGEISEDQVIPSNGGRPALAYRYYYDYSLALVIHMNEKKGQDVLFFTVVNLRDEIRWREEHPLDRFSPDHLYPLIEDIITQFPNIKVIGLGIPGQSVDGEITVSSHHELIGLRLDEEIASRFELPVIVENDVNAAISGYCHRAEEGQNTCVLGVYFPEKYPPGTGIFLNGEVFRGRRGMAGEIKFLPLNIDWSQPLDPKRFIATVCPVLQTLNAILAPDKIVIYRENLKVEQLHQAWKAYISQHPMPTLPDIHVSHTLDDDFEMGMRWLTLKQLDPLPNVNSGN